MVKKGEKEGVGWWGCLGGGKRQYMWRKEEKRKKKGMQLGKYELGRTLGEGNFGKVKYAKDIESGQGFAVKILEKKRILDLKIADQIKREIATLKLLKHPNVVRLHEGSGVRGHGPGVRVRVVVIELDTLIIF
ncbi:CBL-interacting serine/threonine-protein kinase 1 [Vitis vinifera]|uniref:CBL-interacting serine/threonine-protein kinase 1 n=1 Tax=Vitis vinifera TaxID=29760 RepID=A0A438KKN8_VITVI|nr:CBL-interacting serine/threonine-protein kinase 1 [Vitis vinifera]